MGCGSSKVLRPPEILPASRQRDDDRVLVGIGGGGTGANATAAAIVTLPVGRSTGLSLAVNTADHDHPPGDPVAGDPFKAALRLLPFLPRRISTLHDCLLISGRGVPPLSVVPLRAALLLLDVSGFTRLSEAYGRSGTAGCEKFSLVMSDFFRRLTVSRGHAVNDSRYVCVSCLPRLHNIATAFLIARFVGSNRTSLLQQSTY